MNTQAVEELAGIREELALLREDRELERADRSDWIWIYLLWIALGVFLGAVFF